MNLNGLKDWIRIRLHELHCHGECMTWDEYITAQWHESDTDLSLAEYMNMNEAEYAEWLRE